MQQTIEELKKGHGQTWQYILFPKTNYPKDTEDFITRGQHLGIAWRSDRAKMVGEPFSIPVGENETFGNKFWERRANAIKFSFGEGKTDVVFVPVHLKSNLNDSKSSDALFTQKQRQAEAKVFVTQLKVHKTKNGTDDEIKDFKKRHSDHYLVSCVIEVGNDDD